MSNSTPNAKAIPRDDAQLRQAAAALDQVERDKRAAAAGADPAAIAALASVQSAKTAAALKDATDTNRISDATVSRR